MGRWRTLLGCETIGCGSWGHCGIVELPRDIPVDVNVASDNMRQPLDLPLAPW